MCMRMEDSIQFSQRFKELSSPRPEATYNTCIICFNLRPMLILLLKGQLIQVVALLLGVLNAFIDGFDQMVDFGDKLSIVLH